MKFKHPCKRCIVRAACARDCDIADSYGEQFNSIVDSKPFVYTSVITLSLFIIAIYFVLCYFLSIWWLTTVPILWTAEYVILRRNEFEPALKEETILLTVASILMILPATGIIMFLIRWEDYYNKYRPSMKGET